MLNTPNLLPLVVTGASSVFALAATYKIIKYAFWLKPEDHSDDGSLEEEKDGSEADKDDISPTNITVNFEDVKGCENAKSDLAEYIQFFRNKEMFHSVGGAISKGCLLLGPSGTGKTLLARALSKEANVNMYEIKYSQADEGTFYCNGKEIELVDLFTTAKKRAPCIIFLDDLDSDYDKITRPVQEFLFEMDNYDIKDGIIMLAAATSKENVLKDFLKPSRFDKVIDIYQPNMLERKEMLRLYLSKIKHEESVDVDLLSRCFAGRTGKEIRNILNQSAIRATMEHKSRVSMHTIEDMIEKYEIGSEAKSMTRNKDCLKMTAYHEAGHALVIHYNKDTQESPMHKASVLYRASCKGFVLQLRKTDHTNERKIDLLSEMDVSLGGRVAEELIFGKDKIATGTKMHSYFY